ncbi:hypothetical protein ACRAWG_28750 [Methylobacterium sp. P31]
MAEEARGPKLASQNVLGILSRFSSGGSRVSKLKVRAGISTKTLSEVLSEILAEIVTQTINTKIEGIKVEGWAPAPTRSQRGAVVRSSTASRRCSPASWPTVAPTSSSQTFRHGPAHAQPTGPTGGV